MREERKTEREREREKERERENVHKAEEVLMRGDECGRKCVFYMSVDSKPWSLAEAGRRIGERSLRKMERDREGERRGRQGGGWVGEEKMFLM